MTPTIVAGQDLEQDIQQLTRDIVAKKNEAAEKKQAADALVADLKAKGINPLTDADAFAQVDAAYKEVDAIAETLVEMETVRTRAGDWHSEKTKSSRSTMRLGSLAERFMAAESYREHKAAGLFESGSGRVEIQGVEMLAREQLVAHMKNGGGLRAATVDAEPLIPSERLDYGAPVLIPVRQLRIVDLLTVTTTDSNLVNYTAMTARDDNAAATAKGSAYNEANYEFELREAPVRDIGQWIPAHRSELADQGQLQALLERLLSFGVDLALEDEVLGGNGTGQHLTGILETDGINYVDRDTTNSERRVETLHRAITATRLTLFGEPDGMALHPTDYEQTLFEKTESGDGGYVWIGVLAGLSGGTPQSLWGKPVVTTPALTLHTAIVGAFKAGGVVYLRAGVTARASDSHSDFFTRRMVALLAETRAAFAVPLPVAFCEVSLN
jgi:HK97 family phage major capsid protein